MDERVDERDDIVDFLYEVGLLKRFRRTGWAVAGVADAESIADHSHRAAIVALVLAGMEGADPQRAAFLALLHDTQETRTLDIPHLARDYLRAAPNLDVTADQTAALPAGVAALIGSAVAEFEDVETPEAVCAKDADKLECLLQAIEYRASGNAHMQGWIDSAYAALATASARALADAALARDPLAWVHGAGVPRP